MTYNENILTMDNISKSFPGVKALSNVSLSINKGEVMALVGENGAGKSTLMKILLGMYPMDSGTIKFAGKDYKPQNPNDALSNGISMIHQELCLIPTMTVSENIWIGREKKFKTLGIINVKKRNKETKKLMDKLNIHIDPNALVSTLSVANMQLVEVARAVSYQSKIIIMDEPTSALSEAEVNLLYRIIEDLRKEGVAIIFISHLLDEIFRICNKVTVLRDGQLIETLDIKDVDTPLLIKLIAGRELSEIYPEPTATIGDTVIEVDNLNSIGKFNNISFKVRKGEVLGLCGLMGAGRTEIVSAIFGIDKYDSGSIILHGKKVEIRSAADALKNGIGMVTEDRSRTGIFAGLSVRENIAIAYLRSICKLKFVNSKKEKNDVEDMTKLLSVKTANSGVRVDSLSGGNQQKTIIARWLLTNPQVLILDEPTRGIDVGSKSEIYKLINSLAEKGLAIILVSSELPELMGISNRILVVKDGTIVGEQNRDEFNQEVLIKKAFGA